MGVSILVQLLEWNVPGLCDIASSSSSYWPMFVECPKSYGNLTMEIEHFKLCRTLE
jgi:hypothetical protein